MSRKKHHEYTNDFKAQVVRLVLNGQPVAQVAKEHALTKSIVYTWVATYKRAGGFGDAEHKVEMVAELISLRVENKRLALENNMLRSILHA